MWDRYPSLGTIITFDKRGALAVKSHQDPRGGSHSSTVGHGKPQLLFQLRYFCLMISFLNNVMVKVVEPSGVQCFEESKSFEG